MNYPFFILPFSSTKTIIPKGISMSTNTIAHSDTEIIKQYNSDFLGKYVAIDFGIEVSLLEAAGRRLP